MPKPFQYKKGSLIYAQGEGADKVFVLKNGKVSLVYEDIETREDARDQVQPGEFFGVKSALGRFPREENAIATAESVVMAFSIPEFETLALSNTRIVLKMLKVFSTQMRRIHTQISNLMASNNIDPDEGLYALGERYLKLKRYPHAKHVFSRYLTYFPTGAKADLATKNLQVVEIALAMAVDEKPPAKKAPGKAPAADVSAAKDRGIDMDFSSFARFAREYQPNEIIFSEYEPGDTFYLIQSGRVKLIKNAGEYERTLDILLPSETFGEMAILENSPRTASAIALDEVKVLEFTSQNFEILLLGNPIIAFKLLRIFSKRIYDSKRRFMILTLPDSHAKIADVFLMLDETQTNIDKSEDSREFQTTVEDIAHWAGMSVNQARETMNQFAIQNRLEITANRIIVRNINDFSRFVNSRRNQV